MAGSRRSLWLDILSFALFALGAASIGDSVYIVWDLRQPLPPGDAHCFMPLLAVSFLATLGATFWLAFLFSLYRN
jgi:hypothetical protein